MAMEQDDEITPIPEEELDYHAITHDHAIPHSKHHQRHAQMDLKAFLQSTGVSNDADTKPYHGPIGRHLAAGALDSDIAPDEIPNDVPPPPPRHIGRNNPLASDLPYVAPLAINGDLGTSTSNEVTRSSSGTRFDLPPDEDHVSFQNSDRSSWRSRRPTPYYPPDTDLTNKEGAEASWKEKNDTESVSSKESEENNQEKGATHPQLMVSQKMLQNMSLFDGSRGSSFGSEEELKPTVIAPISEKKAWPPKDNRRKKIPIAPWYSPKRYSTRLRVIVGAITLIVVVMAIGLSAGITEKIKRNRPEITSVWKPAPGMTWQIQLSTGAVRPSYMVSTYDLDLFDTNITVINKLHTLGRRVICYFSAGTLEDWRPDASHFPSTAVGNEVSGWDGERWLNTKDTKVRELMKSRIDLAVSKGCDGIDPDNVDGYSATNTGVNLTSTDAIDYIKYLGEYSKKKQLAMGLKNSPEIAAEVVGYVDWVITESCVTYNECSKYQLFIQAGRPVLHIEYPDNPDNPVNDTYTLQNLLFDACTATGTHLYSTLVKKMELDDWYLECPFGIPEYGDF